MHILDILGSQDTENTQEKHLQRHNIYCLEYTNNVKRPRIKRLWSMVRSIRINMHNFDVYIYLRVCVFTSLHDTPDLWAHQNNGERKYRTHKNDGCI